MFQKRWMKCLYYCEVRNFSSLRESFEAVTIFWTAYSELDISKWKQTSKAKYYTECKV